MGDGAISLNCTQSYAGLGFELNCVTRVDNTQKKDVSLQKK